ncbi:MAG: 50S ribosomal protein L18 [Candidatus Riflebacteria bacterium]|nr:50S ribosomal protein L18 [Candidatus Riflebacteria bacterium]
MKLGKQEMRQRRHERSRFYLSGTAQKPRLAVFRSLKHVYAQVIDDETGQTIAMASSLDKDLRGTTTGGNKNGAKTIGQKLAERAMAKGVSAVVFDKGGYKYHGRVKELAEGARAAGLKF